MRKFVIFTAAAVMGMTSGAFAAVVSGSDVCGELPNGKWSWQITTEMVTTGGETNVSSATSTSYSGNPDKNGYNGFETTTTTTTVAPTYQQVNTICTAINPAGKVNSDHSTAVPGELVMTDPGSTSSVTSDPLKICGPGTNTPECPRP
ncbi:hypothetical protein [Sinorhizobium alkalisoli]|uniref:Secreted protein n=1 Tax=Sinorhizobium alkalisoli TaxID=1752398 RepID=A0A1E3V9S8_9HYPH|nr:hypothetical protein [Sinorhizobium alkalisoli]MCG5479579.1 hypothetical protein [Sinorhizobium alkalisoli]ODR90384.1 hypothetical protein A8M32_15810 [Sinorhizobium alkalisoli]